jgi:predicted dehydrogenase
VYSEDISLMNPFRSMDDHYLTKPSGGGAFLSLSHDLDFVLSIFDQTSSAEISFTNNRYSNTGSLVECNLDTIIPFKVDRIKLASVFSLLPGFKSKTGKIQGLNACIEWDFLNSISVIKSANGGTLNSLSLVVDKDELFHRQIDKILSLNEFDHYCQRNLGRAQFIVEANTKIRS